MSNNVAFLMGLIKGGIIGYKGEIVIPFSRNALYLCEALVRKNYISGYNIFKKSLKKRHGFVQAIQVRINYDTLGKNPLSTCKICSSPGRRLYYRKHMINHLLMGHSYLFSTSQGFFWDDEIKAIGMGGEVLFRVN